MIAITGASGKLGQKILHFLTQRPTSDPIIGLVRDVQKCSLPNGVTYRLADYTDTPSLDAALKGVTTLLLISSNAVGERVTQHKNVVDAAKRQGVRHIVYTSILKADTTPLIMAKEHKETEEYIVASGIAYTFMRNGWYTENYIDQIPHIVESLSFASVSSSGVLSTASREDYAEATANVLVSPALKQQRVYELAGNSGFTLGEFADAIRQRAGKAIDHTVVSQDAMYDGLKAAGLSDAFSLALADSDAQAENGWLFDDSGALSTLLGRPTTSLESQLDDYFSR